MGGCMRDEGNGRLPIVNIEFTSFMRGFNGCG